MFIAAAFFCFILAAFIAKGRDMDVRDQEVGLAIKHGTFPFVFSVEQYISTEAILNKYKKVINVL